jgi:hypothetical protein
MPGLHTFAFTSFRHSLSLFLGSCSFHRGSLPVQRLVAVDKPSSLAGSIVACMHVLPAIVQPQHQHQHLQP